MNDTKQPPRDETSTRALMAKPPLAVVARPADPPRPVAPEAGASREARIRDVAYALYQARGGLPGHDVEDWLAAEAAVASESAAPAPQAAPGTH